MAVYNILEAKQVLVFLISNFFINKMSQGHTAGSDTIFVQIYMDAPPGVPGVSKYQIYLFTKKNVEFLR